MGSIPTWGTRISKFFVTKTGMTNQFSDTEFSELVSKSHNFSEVIRSIGSKITGGSFNSVKNRIRRQGLSIVHFTTSPTRGKRNWVAPGSLTVDAILSYDRHGNGRREKSFILRAAAIKSGIEEKCSQCGIGKEWNGRPLTLQLDHINGDYLDNKKENLRFICPNCHTQTDTYGHRNIKTAIVKGTPRAVSQRLRDHRIKVSKERRIQLVCVQCNKEYETIVSRKKVKALCSRECYIRNSEKIKWPSNEDLAAMVRSTSMVKLSAQLGVSDVSIKRRCKSRGISLK